MKHLPTLSDKQYNSLMFIAEYLWQHGYQPLQSEIGAHLGVSANTARLFIVALESKGYLKRVHKQIYLLHVPGFPYARQVGGKAA